MSTNKDLIWSANPETLAKVSLLWALADWFGTPVEWVVTSRFEISPRHARRLVYQARKAGLVPSRRNKDAGYIAKMRS
jgi:hypothetical protein